jgi:hypothetical protein
MPNKIEITLQVDDKGGIKKIDTTDKELAGLIRTAKEAEGPFHKLAEGWGLCAAKLGVILGAAYSAKKFFYDLPLSIASLNSEIEREAGVLGITIDEFQKFQYAGKMADVEAQELTMGLKLLSRSMEDASKGLGESPKYFTAMGIAVKDTEGNLRPLNEVMGDIMDKFAAWEDGPRKVAIAMQLFGRSGEALIPLLNKGRSGFEALSKEAERLGIILSPDLVRKGSEAEDIFKKLDVQVKALKLSFAGYALELAKAANGIIEFFRAGEEAYQKSWIKKVMDFPGKLSTSFWEQWAKLGQAIGAVQMPKSPEISESRYLVAWQAKAKIQPPAITEATEDLLSESEMLFDDWFKAYVAYWDKIEAEAKKNEEETKSLNQALLANVELRVNEEIELEKKKYDEAMKLAVQNEADQKELNEALLKNAQLRIDEEIALESKAHDQFHDLWQSLGQNFSDAWTTNMTRMIRGAEDAGDALKNIWESMLDTYISAVSKMIMEWALFENVQGGGKKFLGGGSGLGSIVGWIGGLLGAVLGEGGIVKGFRPLAPLQEGGIISRPTLGLIGEGGPEAVIPLKGGKIPVEGGAGNTFVIINANDAKSFDDMVRRNPDSILGVIRRFNRIAGGSVNMIGG